MCQYHVLNTKPQTNSPADRQNESHHAGPLACLSQACTLTARQQRSTWVTSTKGRTAVTLSSWKVREWSVASVIHIPIHEQAGIL